MTAIKSYLRSTAQGPLNAQLICKDIRFFCRFEYDLGALRRGTPLRVRSRVQKPCLMRYLHHNQCDGRPHSTPTSGRPGTRHRGRLGARRLMLRRATRWGAPPRLRAPGEHRRLSREMPMCCKWCTSSGALHLAPLRECPGLQTRGDASTGPLKVNFRFRPEAAAGRITHSTTGDG